MTSELLNIDFQKIHVVAATIDFPEYESLKQQALQLATNIEQVEVTEENIQLSKKLIAAVNKRVKEIEDKRISIKKELLEPYNLFEQQVKEIVTIVKDADAVVREQISELEEKEREEKEAVIAELFEKRIRQYSFGEVFTFENFIKPNHLNKTTSLKSIETDMVAWLEKIDGDLKAITSLPNSDKILTEYYDTKDVSVAIRIVNDREELKNKLTNSVEPKKQDADYYYNIQILDHTDIPSVETLLRLNNIKYTMEKVAK